MGQGVGPRWEDVERGLTGTQRAGFSVLSALKRTGGLCINVSGRRH